MKKTTKTFIVLIAVCLSFSLSSAKAIKNTAPKGMVYLDIELMDAVREICLLYQGSGFWENASMQTVGCSIMESEEHGNLMTLAVYTAHRVFDTSAEVPQDIAGGERPVLIIIREIEDKAYELVTYTEPEDGTKYERSMQKMFSKHLAKQMLSQEKDIYVQAARADARAMAEAYLDCKSGHEKNGVWKEFLQTGSNPQAMQIIRNAVDSYFPNYQGSWFWQYGQKLYTLWVEGEQSYSGILSFATYDAIGEQLTGFKVHVQDDQLIVLEGELPELVVE